MKLALGAVQFGLDYGISNTAGKTPIDEARRILEKAKAAAVNTIDTAAAYGESESLLGEIGMAGWHVLTKIPKLPSDGQDGKEWVQRHIFQSLDKLGLQRLEGLLLHDASDLFKPQGNSVAIELQELKSKGLVNKIGYSIYSPDQLSESVTIMQPDLIQAPFNIFDQRLAKSGWLNRLNHMGTEVHIRSIFMQGLLLMSSEKRPPYFNKWGDLWRRWDAIVEGGDVTAQELCLSFVKSYSGISHVVVGVENVSHLDELLAAWNKPIAFDGSEFSCDDAELLDPVRWRLK